jgi:hypothetical protein
LSVGDVWKLEPVGLSTLTPRHDAAELSKKAARQLLLHFIAVASGNTIVQDDGVPATLTLARYICAREIGRITVFLGAVQYTC